MNFSVLVSESSQLTVKYRNLKESLSIYTAAPWGGVSGQFLESDAQSLFPAVLKYETKMIK